MNAVVEPGILKSLTPDTPGWAPPHPTARPSSAADHPADQSSYQSSDHPAHAGRGRVRLDCLIRLKYEAQGPCTFVMNVEPAMSAQQIVVSEQLGIAAAHQGLQRDVNALGMRLIRFCAEGPVQVESRFVVDLHHHVETGAMPREMLPHELPLDVLNYVAPSRYCESDKLMNFARSEFGWREPGYERVQAIASWVRDNVQFRVGTTRWETSAADVLEQRQGVCRDFAHVMIAMCRALNIPARFVTGIDYGADPALGPVDFHAYVEAFLGGRWYLFDPTGISPTTGLIRLGTGRDAADVSFATIFGQVASWAPYLEVQAIEDPEHGLIAPVPTDQPVSTAAPERSIT